MILRSPLPSIDRYPLTVAPSTLLADAIALMSQQRKTCALLESESRAKMSSSCVLVVEKNQLVGLFCEGDAVKLTAAESCGEGVRVAEVMTRNSIVLKESEFSDIFTAINLFRQHSIRHLPIVDEAGKLVGLVTKDSICQLIQSADLLRWRRVGEVMTTNPITCPITASVLDVAELMARHQVSCAIICEGLEVAETAQKQLMPIGTVNGGDVVQCQALGLNLRETAALSVMSSPIFCLHPEADLWEANQKMLDRQVRQLPVIDSKGELVGILNQNCLLKIFDQTEMYRSIEVLHQEVALLQDKHTDATDRQNAENALRHSEARYRAIVEDQTDLICRYLPDRKITFVNQAYCRYFGLSAADAIGNSFMRLILEEDRAFLEEHYASVSPDKPFFSCEHRVILPSGEIRTQQWSDRAIFDETGTIVEYQAVGRDVSDRKQAETALQQLNAELEQRVQQRTKRYELAVTAGKVGVWDWNLETDEIYIDPFLKAFLGYQEFEVGNCTKDWQSLIHPDDIDALTAKVNAHLQGLTPDFEVEHRMLCKDGSIRWMHARGTAIRSENGKPYRVTGTVTEITDRKLIEAALQKSEEQFRNLFDDAPIALCLARVDDFRMIKVNEAYRQMLGYSDSELQATTFTQLTHPEDIEADLEQFQQLVEGNISRFAIEKRLIKKNGDFLWANITVTLLRDRDGTSVYSMGAIQDISHRKGAELELQQLKERLQFLLASNPAVIFTVGAQGDFAITYISENVRAIVGYNPEEFLADSNFWYSHIHPEDIRQFLICFANLSRPGNRTCEYRFLHRDGQYRWLRTELKLLADSRGKPSEIIGYAADISNSKYAEIARRQQFEQERLVEAIARRVRQSLQLVEILNTTVVELQQVLLADRVLVYQILPDGRGKVVAEAVADGCSQLLNAIFSAEALGVANYQDYLEYRLEDISEQEKLIISPCLSDFLPEIAVSAKLIVPIVQLNQVWGLLIAHQCDRDRNWLEWEVHLFQQLAIAIQQSLLYQQLQAELNERKQAEEKLKNSLKEKEILLKEIHHRVKNNLCVVASLLELQSDIVADSQLAKMFEESQNRLYSMALIHEKLYRSTNLAQINFGEYLEDLVTNLFHSYNINDRRIELQVLAEPIFLNLETATPCGLIANELVSNTLKHAFGDRRSGTVSVECYQTGDLKIHLLVKDNGTGFPKNLDFRKTGSMGFQVVCTLTEQLEATLELSGEVGTTFHLTFNELKYSHRF